MSPSPSAFAAEWIATLAKSAAMPRQALDVAMGRGRHALVLARYGFETFGVDVDVDAVRAAMESAARESLRIRGWCANLTATPLPERAFDVVLVTRYLQRDLFPAIQASLRAGGCVVYETFTTAQRELGAGPRSPDHLLQPGELRSAFDGLDVLFYEELKVVEGDRPEALARLVAQRRSRF
jgi:tellurite methyltransferase